MKTIRANEAIKILNQPPILISNPSENREIPENMPCDPWHVAGPITFNDPCEQRALLIKTKLPNIKFPVEVGSTGYINWPNSNELPERGWTLDTLGRLVGVVGKFRFFQRYTNSCRLVGSVDGSYFTDFTQEELSELDSLLS